MDIIRKTFEARVKAKDDEKLIAEHFISTEKVDRHGDIVRARGMKIFGKPVVLLQHGRGHMGAEPVAKPVKITRGEFEGEKGIIAVTQFYPDELGQRLYEKTTTGYMPNWSIGFLPIKQEPRKDDEGKPIQDPFGMGGRDIKEWELLEYSIVGVPAQPDAQTVPGKKDAISEGIAFKMMGAKFDESEKCPECGSDLAVEHGFEFPEGKEPETILFCQKCKEKAETSGLPKCAACADTRVVKTVLDGTETESPCTVCFFWPPDWNKVKADEEWEPTDEKPYPNEHACRVADPKKYEKFRRQNNKFGTGIHAIWGIKGSATELQAIRFDAKKFTAAQARKWATDHDHKCAMFEPASNKVEAEELLSGLTAALAGMTAEFKKLNESIGEMKSVVDVLSKAISEADDPSKSGDPGDPDSGAHGGGDPNTPEGKVGAAKLIFVEKKEAKRKREFLMGVIAEALDAEVERRYRKDVLGKVD